MTASLVPLTRCGMGEAVVVGRAAAALGELAAEGVPVPDGAVLLPSAVGLSDGELAALLTGPLDGRYTVRVADGVRPALGDLAADEVVAAVRACWASAGPQPVLVQRTAPVTASGVASWAGSSVLVSGVPGSGGAALPDEWLVRGGDAVCRRSPHDTVDATTALTVADLLRRVEKRLGGQQEIEWALVDGRVVLLCARQAEPPPEPVPVPVVVPEGFWERDVSHSPRPWTPMLGSVFFDVRDAALRELFATFGLLVETLEFRQIGGWEYSRLVPLGGKDRRPPPWLFALLTRVLPAMRRRIRACVAAVREDAACAMVDRWYAEWQPDLIGRAVALKAEDLPALDDDALAAHTDRALALLHDGSRRHFLLQGAFGFPVAELVFATEELLGWTEERTFRLLAGLSEMSTRPARRLGEIARRAGAHPRLRALLATGAPRLDAVRAVAPEVADELDGYIAEFGQRSLSFEIADPSIAELPALTLRLFVDFARRGYDPEAERSALAAARAEAVAEARELLADRPAAVRERFERVLARARLAYPVREDNEYSTFGVPMALLRRAVLEHGARLAERGVLARRDDVFWLTLPQAGAALRATAATSPRAAAAGAVRAGAGAAAGAGALAATRAEVARAVAAAKGAHAWVGRHPAPATYGRRPGPPPALDALPPEALFAMRAMMWAVESILAPESSNRDASPTDVSGIPAVPGRHTGRVRIVRDESELGRIRPGDVLVCPVAAPVWSVVFPSVGALVTDSGGLLSHSAIIAREYRVPAVVATGSATSTLRDGQVVRVDGTTGRVDVIVAGG